MKKISVILIVSMLLLIMTISAHATEGHGNVYQADDMTIQFDSSSQFTPEEQQRIAEFLTSGSSDTTPLGLSCILFGHNYKTDVVTVVKHKAHASAPRCLEEKYEIRVCTKCEDTQQTLVASRYINCCS